MRCVCVFAGSNPGKRPEYVQMTQELGRALVKKGLSVVYGGGSIGLMGTLADAVLEAGGEITGVMPKRLFKREVEHTNLTHLYQVGSMHERKALMSDLADGFIALPGGFGTLDELFEIITWAQIGIHNKPIGLLNVAHYYNPLLQMVQHMVAEGFVVSRHAQLFIERDTPEALIDDLISFNPPEPIEKWIELPPKR